MNLRRVAVGRAGEPRSAGVALRAPPATQRASKCSLNLELHALRQWQIAAEIKRAGLATHVGLPGVGARFASATGFFLAAKGPADLGAAGANVDVGNPAV